MISWRNIPVKWQIVIVVVSVSITTAILTIFFDYKHEVARHKSDILKTTRLEALSVGCSCAYFVDKADNTSAERRLQVLREYPFIHDCILFDAGGRKVAEYHKSNAKRADEGRFAKTARAWMSTKRNVQVYLPLTNNGERCGSIYMNSIPDITTIQNDILRFAMLLLVAILIFTLMIIAFLNQIITKPITQLSCITREITASRNYNVSIHKRFYGEIGSLYDDFNNMLDTIRKSDNDRKVFQDELVASNEMYKTLVENIPGIVFRLVFDKTWVIDFIGEGVGELTGYPHEYFQGKNIVVLEKIIAPEEKISFFKGLFDNTGSELEFEHIHRIITLNGQEKWVLIKGKHMVDQINKKMKLDGVILDRTESKRAVDQLEKTEKRYRDLFENLNDAAILIESDTGLIVETNKVCEQMFGLTADELRGKYYNMLLSTSETKFEATDHMEKVLSGILDFNAEVTSGTGKVMPVHVKSSFIVIGEKEHLLCLIRDVSERVQYEMKLKVAKEKAEESDRLKTMFLSNMSHEIRTPMNGILGFSKLLSLPATEEEKVKYLTIIESSGKQLLHVIDDILDISKIETNQLVFKKDAFNINGLIDEVVRIISQQAANKGKNIEVRAIKPAHDGEDVIVSDRFRLFQVLANLANNAEKFTEEGFVDIRYRILENNGVEFKVSDSGMGIPDDKKNLVFMRFCQADSSITSRYGGTGLGLPIAKGIVEKLGGTLWFESEAGKGTAFYVSLPNCVAKKLG